MSFPSAHQPIPYAAFTPSRPGVVTWFKAYALGMALLYLLCTAGGLAAFSYADRIADAETSATDWRVMGTIFAVMGVPLAGIFAAGALLPARPWVWIYDLVLICIGLTSACLWPATIPLLIFWIKPETKVWFGRAP